MTPEEKKAKAAERWARYYEANRDRLVAAAAARRAADPERAREIKVKYYASSKGKAQKRKEDLAYIASGGRAKTEAKRAAKPLSTARKVARLTYQLKKRAADSAMSVFDKFVLAEAVHLCKLRANALGGEWHVDHVVPISLGGTSEASNIQVVPGLWNRKKSNKHSDRFFGA
jgi:pyruvate/2-oxoglutarate dehydrogenase complex dihydrolipoamide acyltransferase (E2) component